MTKVNGQIGQYKKPLNHFLELLFLYTELKKKKKRETSGMTAAAWFSSATFFFTRGMETRRTKCTDTISLMAQQEGKSDIQ